MRDKRMRDITVGSLLKVCTCPHIDEDIALVEDFRQLPLPQDTSRMECLLLAVCLEGEARYTVDTAEHTVHPNDIIIVSHNQKTGRSWLSPDCKGIGLLLDYDFFHEAIKNIHEMSSLFIFARFNPVYKLLPEETERIKTYLSMIRNKIGNTRHHFRKETVQSLITAMIYDVSNALYRSQTSRSATSTSAEKIFAGFIKLVEDNFREQRKLSWYGQQLCITPKYLYGAVKQVSKCTPTDWIDDYVTLEIKLMLKNTTKSIKEIAQELNFSSQSFLGKYFKDRVGVSPKEYRKN
ncbi:MAG: AraC family transcriptional regulator [Prevotellaceae bacterium]|nr:AraC family transcriptional regulator [Prevotella sp.]MCI7786879.1 AraC family transcriptional regulator [Prevotella sp.]MDD5876261.1 AraC family transcriptional regulator [Prevotellaceae bacterium]MDD7421430.1 AraC family transcriptional regulator [Prevotellaceae bacterium]